ncbi:MAG: ABC transporter substrate-binding protein, partial [Candidatus Rokubacteria bacterium]|nr:ABC transporter substrate-binding protein [Candidatus Rokubacteria bacterium]
IAALDRYTVEIALVESFAPFVSLLALGHAKIVPRDIVEARGDAFGAQPVGSGPFRFVQWDHGKEIVLAGNPDYFDGPPALSRLVYRIFSGDSTAAMFKQFEQGALEDAPVPTGQRLGSGDPRFQYIRRTTYSARFYGFNTRVKPLDDRRVRQAIVHAVDRDTILHEVFLDRFHPARGIIPPGTPGFDPSPQGFAYDPARARDLLRQAGYSAARPLPVIPAWSTARSETVVREHEMMKRALAAVGVSLDVRYQQDWPSFLRLLGEGRAPMFLYAWHADAPDPDNFLFKLFHSRGPRNFFGYANPAFDDLIRRARSEPDPTRRVELYRRAERMVLDDAVILPVWHYVYEHVFQPYVRSVQVNGLGDPYIPMRKIWLDRR